jgi:multidrug efflux pump subunit AcrA (membrane-fusion protein)
MVYKVLIILGVLLLASGAIGYWLSTGAGKNASERGDGQGTRTEESRPVAEVQTAAVEHKSISETLTTYGGVVAAPGKTHFVEVSFESRIKHILVSAGQVVNKGDALLEIEATAASLLQLQQAETADEEAHKELETDEKTLRLEIGYQSGTLPGRKSCSGRRFTAEQPSPARGWCYA